MAQRLKRLLAMQETWVQSLGREDSPGEGNGNPLQCLAWRSPVDYSARGRKESDTTERLHFHFSWYITPSLPLLLSHFSRVQLCVTP